MKDLNGKTVVITGGATGIGFALAKAFGVRGSRIIIAEMREHRLEEAVATLGELGVDAKHCVCDVTDLEQVEALADFAWTENGQVDVVLNNAGISAPQRPLWETPLEDLHAVFDVNFFGVWHGCRVFTPRLLEQGTPAIILNTGSENALFNAVPNAAAYVASKHAVLALTDSLREQVPEHIQVGLINPGWVKSELMSEEVGRMAMDTDRFAEIVMAQVEAGEFYIVSHAYNKVRIDARYEELSRAYEQYAPRYDGDDEYDVRTVLARLAQGRSNG